MQSHSPRYRQLKDKPPSVSQYRNQQQQQKQHQHIPNYFHLHNYRAFNRSAHRNGKDSHGFVRPRESACRMKITNFPLIYFLKRQPAQCSLKCWQSFFNCTFTMCHVHRVSFWMCSVSLHSHSQWANGLCSVLWTITTFSWQIYALSVWVCVLCGKRLFWIFHFFIFVALAVVLFFRSSLLRFYFNPMNVFIY